MLRFCTSNERTYHLMRNLRIVSRFLLRRTHESDFAAFRSFGDRAGIFLDIGANAGQSALSFRLFNRRAPILSIEPNPYHERDLRLVKRLIRDFDYVLCAAGAESASAELYVPVYRGIPLTGEASLDRETAKQGRWLRERLRVENSPQLTIVEQSVVVRRLDDMDLAPGFVKIDVQGHELQVLQGLVKTLRRHRPVLMIEQNPENVGRVCDFLRPLGYEPFVYEHEHRAFEPYRNEAALNIFFLTAEAAAFARGRS